MTNLNAAHFALTETYDSYRRDALKQALRYLTVTVLSTLILYIGIFCMPQLVYAYTNPDTSNEYEEEVAVQKLASYSDNLLQVFDQEDPDLSGLLPEPVYHSDVNWYLYSGYYTKWSTPASRAWSHARDLYYRGLIHGSSTDYQCTFFAQMWFYDVYGFNSSGNGPSGNGDNFAMYVYNSAVYYDEEGVLHHLFKIDDHPETMGIVSISASSPHVLCVDEVDQRNDTITISDGNVMGNGEVRLRVTYSMSEFYRVNPGRYVFVNPTEELLEMLKNR